MKYNNDISKIIAALCDADMRTTNKDVELFAGTITVEDIENAMKAVK